MTTVVNLSHRACALSCWCRCPALNVFSSSHGKAVLGRRMDLSRLLQGAELVEVAAEKGDGDAAEVLRGPSEHAQLFVRSV
jgi:hypothetical protein